MSSFSISNRYQLGSDYKKLGKDKGSFKSKYYLSFKKTEEGTSWKIKKLNFFQKFLRSSFGAYKSTHLKPVVEALREQRDVEDSLIRRMRAIWKSKYAEPSGLKTQAQRRADRTQAQREAERRRAERGLQREGLQNRKNNTRHREDRTQDRAKGEERAKEDRAQHGEERAKYGEKRPRLGEGRASHGEDREGAKRAELGRKGKNFKHEPQSFENSDKNLICDEISLHEKHKSYSEDKLGVRKSPDSLQAHEVISREEMPGFKESKKSDDAKPIHTEPLINEAIANQEAIKLPENRHYPQLSQIELGKRESLYLFEPDEIFVVHGFSERKERLAEGSKQVVFNYNEKNLAVICQHGQKGSTAAAAYMLLKDHGRNMALDRFFNRHEGGAVDILADIRRAGLKGELVNLQAKDSTERLKELREELLRNGPAIVSIDDDGFEGHVIVVDEVSQDLSRVRLRDPYHGWDITISGKAFLKRWDADGYLIQIPQTKASEASSSTDKSRKTKKRVRFAEELQQSSSSANNRMVQAKPSSGTDMQPKKKIAEQEEKKLPENRRYPEISFGEKGKRKEGSLFKPEEILRVHDFTEEKESLGVGDMRVEINYDENKRAVICQHGQKGCTAAVVFMLLKDHGEDMDLERFFNRQMGDAEDMLRDFKRAGLEGIEVELKAEDPDERLMELREELVKNGPAIVDIDDKILGAHVIIVDDVSEDLSEVSLRDPFHGWSITVSKEAFLERFKGNEYLIQIPKS